MNDSAQEVVRTLRERPEHRRRILCGPGSAFTLGLAAAHYEVQRTASASRLVELVFDGFLWAGDDFPGFSIECRSRRGRLRLRIDGRLYRRRIRYGHGVDVVRQPNGKPRLIPWRRSGERKQRERELLLPAAGEANIFVDASAGNLALRTQGLANVALFALRRPIAVRNLGPSWIMLRLDAALEAAPVPLGPGASALVEVVEGRLAAMRLGGQT